MNESIDHLHEVSDAFGPIRARRMFGGWGIYHDGLMFGLYAQGRLYLKTDAHNVAQFEAAGSEPFTYIQRDKPVKLSYAKLHRRLQHLAIFLRRSDAWIGLVAMVGHCAFDDFVKPRRFHPHLGQAFGQT